MRTRDKFIIALGVCGLFAGCSTNDLKPYEPNSSKARTLFLPSYRTAAPDRVYARTRWVHPPEVLPSRNGSSTDFSDPSQPTLRPIYELTLEDTSLEQTCKVLATMARYSSYTSPSLRDQKISVKNLGTIDELARIIEDRAGIKVMVDHENKEVRFLVRPSKSG